MIFAKNCKKYVQICQSYSRKTVASFFPGHWVELTNVVSLTQNSWFWKILTEIQQV